MIFDAQKESEILAKAAEATKLYSIALPKLNIEEPLKSGIGSGTLVTTQGIVGILTNEHVSEMFEENDPKQIDIPDRDGKLRTIKFSDVIALASRSDSEYGIDIALIVLDIGANDVINLLGKKLWNLDQSYAQWKALTSVIGSLWMIHGYVDEEKRILKRNNKRIVLDYCNAAPYVVVPSSEPEYHEVSYHKLVLENLRIDNILCPLKTIEITPGSFEGMSGGALWQVFFDAQYTKIVKVNLVGLAAQQLYDYDGKVEKLICRGPVALYESFYPYFIKRLAMINR